MMAYELSFRDPALALEEVRAAYSDPELRRKKKTLRLCLHHVADASTALELYHDGDFFDPDALHLSAFAACLADFESALPQMNSDEARGHLEKLGFLTGPVTNPIVDGPQGSEAYKSSADRYREIIVRFLKTVFDAPVSIPFRLELTEHLRRTYAHEADEFLLNCWARGDLPAAAVFGRVSRIGWNRATALLGTKRLDSLLSDFLTALEALSSAPTPFESMALDIGSLSELPPHVVHRVAFALLDLPRFAERHRSAAEILLANLDKDPDPMRTARDLLERAEHLSVELIVRIAARIPYADVQARLSSGHPALVKHPDAPPDRTWLLEGTALLSSDPGRACELLQRVVRDTRHPDAHAAYEQLLAAARGAMGLGSRRFAFHSLGELGDARATPVLIEALGDPDLSDSRLLLVAALCRAGDRRALTPLRTLALSTPSLDIIPAIRSLEERLRDR